VRLFIAGYGNLSNVRCCFLDKTSTPILFEIANSYQIFLEGFTRDNENFWESKLLENNALFLRLREKLPLKIGFFEQVFFTNNKEKILNLRIIDFFLTKDSYKPFDDFKTSTGLNIDRDRFDSLKKLASNAKLKYTKQEPIEKKTTDILTYLMRGTKGCKRYRKKIIGKLEKYIPHNIVKFASNTETIIGIKDSHSLNGVWTKNFFSCATKSFLFKLHNNTAGYNNVAAHFVRGHSPNCTFCDILLNPEEEPETPLHMFFSCEPINQFVENIFSWVLSQRANITRQEFFVGFNRQDHRKNDALFLITALVKKFIWDCKIRFSLPGLERGKIFIIEAINIILSTSAKAEQIFLNANLNLQLG